MQSKKSAPVPPIAPAARLKASSGQNWKRLMLALALLLLSACATPQSYQQEQPKKKPDPACSRAFKPYSGPVNEVEPHEARVFITGHQAAGSVYCGPRWGKE